MKLQHAIRNKVKSIREESDAVIKHTEKIRMKRVMGVTKVKVSKERVKAANESIKVILKGKVLTKEQTRKTVDDLHHLQEALERIEKRL